jgi:hypothetical protein
MQSDDCLGMKKYISHRVWILFLLLSFWGCGYQLQKRGDTLPSDIQSVAIPVFANRTNQTGIESEITRSLIEKFVAAKSLAVTEKKLADAVITGTIQSFVTSPVAVTSGTQITTEYRATITVQIIFQRQRDGKILWKEEMSEWRNYPVVTDLALTNKYQREAIQQIGVLLAERVHEFILGSF